MRYQNTSIDKVIEVINITRRITWIDPNAKSPCPAICKPIEKGNISIISWLDFTVLHMYTFTQIFTWNMEEKNADMWPVLGLMQWLETWSITTMITFRIHDTHTIPLLYIIKSDSQPWTAIYLCFISGILIKDLYWNE